MMTISEIAKKTKLSESMVYQRLRHKNISPAKKVWRTNYYRNSVVKEAITKPQIKDRSKYSAEQRITILQYYQMHLIKSAKQLSEELNVSYEICKILVREYNESGCIIIQSKL